MERKNAWKAYDDGQLAALEELAAGESADSEAICETLKKAGYSYDPAQNRFVISD